MYFLCDRKYQRTGQSCTAFGASFAHKLQTALLLQYSSVGSHLAPRSLSQCLGRQELAALKHHTAYFQALLGCSLCLPTLPFRFQRRITFCNKNLLECIADFNSYNSNVKETPAVSKSQRKSLLFGGHCVRYVQT